MTPHRDGVRLCKAPTCRARIRFLTSENHRPLVVDADPIDHDDAAAEPRGVFYVAADGRAYKWTPTDTNAAGADLYRSHWGTCTEPGRFRR